jgi:general secretion pathway protein B
MSSILDALRKLEKEKTERGEMLSTAVAGDILRTDHGRRRRQWLLPAFLFLILMLLLVAVLLLVSATQSPLPVSLSVSPSPAPATPTTIVGPVTSPISDVPSVTRPVFVSPPAVAVLPANLPVLTGIVYQSDRQSRIAILNDLPVMEATVIDGYHLQRINPDHVIVERDGQFYTLRMSPSNN